MPIEGAFRYDVEIEEIIKKSMYFDYIGMIDKHLYFYFSYELLDHVVFTYRTLRHDFDSTYHFTLFFNC